LLKAIALTTALLATLGAVAALKAGATVNEALMLKPRLASFMPKRRIHGHIIKRKGLRPQYKRPLVPLGLPLERNLLLTLK